MGADNLDARLAPLAEFLLVVILMAMAAALASYVIVKVVNRRKEQAHNKLSASRRGKDTGINLLGADDEDAPEERGPSQRRKPRQRSSFDFVGFLREIAHRLERPKPRRRGKGRRRSSSDNLRIDILKKVQPGADEKQGRPGS